MQYMCQKLLLLFSLSGFAAASLLECNKTISVHDFDSPSYSKQCFSELLKKYHVKMDHKFEASQKISLPIIRNFASGRVLA